jgi:prophage DNA circulation protein
VARYKGSFRGVPFLTESSQGVIGRRVIIDEFPNKDEASAEDVGAKANSFNLSIFVIGADWEQQRDNLEAAFNKKGPGEFIHPWRGAMNVTLTDCQPSENIAQGSRQSWTISITKVGTNSQPTVRADTVAVVDAASDKALAAVQDDFAEEFTVEDVPEFVEQDAISQVNEALDSVIDASRSMLPDMSILPAFTANAGKILSKITTLLRTPTNLASQFTGQISGILGLGNSPLAAFNALKRLFGYQPNKVARSTPSRIQQDNNRIAVANLTRQAAVIEAARATSTIEFDSQDQAVIIRDQVIDAINTEQLTASDPVFEALADLRTAVVNDINTRAIDLSKLVKFTPQSTLPAVVLAYRLYGSANREQEIITRNRIAHPGFVPGGRALEVLSDD